VLEKMPATLGVVASFDTRNSNGGNEFHRCERSFGFCVRSLES
jgi:hypothetical protein